MGWRFERRPAFSLDSAYGWTRFYKDGTIKDYSYGYGVEHVGYWRVHKGVVYTWNKWRIVCDWRPADRHIQELYANYLNKIMLGHYEDSPWSRFANRVTGWWYGVGKHVFSEE